MPDGAEAAAAAPNRRTGRGTSLPTTTSSYTTLRWSSDDDWAAGLLSGGAGALGWQARPFHSIRPHAECHYALPLFLSVCVVWHASFFLLCFKFYLISFELEELALPRRTCNAPPETCGSWGGGWGVAAPLSFRACPAACSPPPPCLGHHHCRKSTAVVELEALGQQRCCSEWSIAE